MDYYFQIKAKRSKKDPDRTNPYGGVSNWVFPPLFSGKVEAKDKDEANEKINKLYGKKFPRRVAKKDLKSNEFLLHLEEIKAGTYTASLFDEKECEHCKRPYRMIDKYNDSHCDYHGWGYCSYHCKEQAYQIQQYKRKEMENNGMGGTRAPVIYKITNKATNKVYVGKTTQVFTLRWYQHFFQSENTKFHQEINSTKVTDWLFEVIEIVSIPDELKASTDIQKYIASREVYWMNHYDSINNGYNSVVSDKDELDRILPNLFHNENNNSQQVLSGQ